MKAVAVPALKNQKEVGDVDVIFSQKVYPANFMPFFFDNFCRLLEFGGMTQIALNIEFTSIAANQMRDRITFRANLIKYHLFVFCCIFHCYQC